MNDVLQNIAVIEQDKQRKRARIILGLLFLFPLAIVGAASFVYYTGIGMPHGTTSKGTLISPPLQINEVTLTNVDNQTVKFSNPAHQWTFMQIGESDCDDICSKTLWQTRQTHIALGKYQGKIRRVYLNVGASITPSFSALLAQEHPDVTVINANQMQLNKLFADTVPAINVYSPGLLYVVDPRGFIMLYYTEMMAEDKLRYKDVIADMKHLLRGQD
jgi:hypothetical protein